MKMAQHAAVRTRASLRCDNFGPWGAPAWVNLWLWGETFYGCRSTLDNLFIFLYRKGRCQVPIFPRFCECSVVAISFSILYVHIPVKVLLEIHTDCQTSSGLPKNVQRVMKVLKEKEGGKTNIVCVYIYMASLRGRGGQGKETKKNGGFSPLLALLFA